MVIFRMLTHKNKMRPHFCGLFFFCTENQKNKEKKANKNNFILHINEEREIPGRQKVVRGSSVPILTSHVGLNPRSKSGYEREARVIKTID